MAAIVENWRVTHIDGGLEFESREDEVRDAAGTRKLKKVEAASTEEDTGGEDDNYSVKKVKDVWYRKRYTVTLERLVCYPKGSGFSFATIEGRKRSAVAWTGGASGTFSAGEVDFIAGECACDEINSVLHLYRETQNWTGYGPWLRAPASWGLAQIDAPEDDGATED